jgi:hypothetical protein
VKVLFWFSKTIFKRFADSKKAQIQVITDATDQLATNKQLHQCHFAKLYAGSQSNHQAAYQIRRQTQLYLQLGTKERFYIRSGVMTVILMLVSAAN